MMPSSIDVASCSSPVTPADGSVCPAVVISRVPTDAHRQARPRAGVAWKDCTARATGTVSIHEAIRRKDLQAVKKCIESGRDVNVKGPDGNYPLASAAHDGLTEIVDTLLVNGAEVNKQAAPGATAASTAAAVEASRPASFLTL